MLEAVAGLLALLLILTGIAIMVGPGPWRNLRRRRRERGLQPKTVRPRTMRPVRSAERVPVPDTSHINPTTQRALSSASKLVDLLTDHGAQRHATAVRLAAGRLRHEEVNGIYAMQEALSHLQRVRVDDRADQEIMQGLIATVERALRDRMEQLEIYPRR
ncbi:MAG: hypothetical protein J2P38_05565 [Candidatus Dormibacteraeota bacterium]|nr:hypothetical protein [Candidatus Dormibacteraeota bacterium]